MDGMAGQGELTRPSGWRVLSVSVAAVALVLWGWSDWDLWVLVPLVGGLIVARLVIGLAPHQWRDWVSTRAVAALAVFVALWLVRLVPLAGVGVAVGVGGLVCVWQLRTVLRPRLRWTAAGVAAGLVVGCGTVAAATWVADQNKRAANERAERDYRVAELRPDKPLAVLHGVVKAIHDNDPALVCFLFTPTAEHAFADATGTTTCETAITALHGQITGKGYGNATATGNDITPESHGKPATVSGCHMYIVAGPLEHQTPPGPRLGVFELERDPRFPDSGYLITDYTPCDQADQNPTSTTPPPVLPSYPPSFVGILTRAIAANDPTACAYFTPQGASQFAATHRTASCPAALGALHTDVTDPTAYANPSGATTNTTPTGTEINACALTWNRWGQGPITAGPQLGHLTLTQPDPATPGYLINTVRGC